ncbi:putative tricarboxylic transport membrane protein [Pseudochelatococcus lubricantis]|uniref:Tricarboxylic transport membrane protein n=1 Tax=Pseudochelatococcus lubricantis TaxID=1538102 RepID=A0ABX0V3C0_9HYPH|nr:tripartite tricarboxylate transporter substrate binding protein [Pseudochelatococcus lubricantis]NIJ59719.1 putative tricarboxylic transport membrane protein [Pseudochelatococcus lubricantis]
MRLKSFLLPLAIMAAAFISSAQAQVNVMLPANPGGGWDATGRQAFQALNAAGLYKGGVNFTNKGGAGGTIGLAEFQRQQAGKPDALAVFGAITVGSIVLNNSPIDLAKFRPVARLTAEYLVIAVAQNSPHKTLQDLVAALKSNPGGTAVGGGSAGGVDHIALALLAQSAGVPVAELNYIPQTSGAETVTGIVNGTLTAGFSGISEFAQFAEQGRVRILAITSAERVKGLEVPTFKEAGFDVEIANWRGILGAPGMPEDNYAAWVDRFTKLSETPAWKGVLEKQGWDAFFLPGQQFGTFIAAESERIGKILKEAGLAQ